MAYGLEVWGGCSTTLLEKIFLLQKSAIRTMLNRPQAEHCREHFKNLKIMTVHSLYAYKLILYTKEEWEAGRLTVNSSTHSYNTRNPLHIASTTVRTTKRQHGTVTRGKHLFNKLPLQIKQLPFTKFTKDLKNSLRQIRSILSKRSNAHSHPWESKSALG